MSFDPNSDFSTENQSAIDGLSSHPFNSSFFVRVEKSRTADTRTTAKGVTFHGLRAWIIQLFSISILVDVLDDWISRYREGRHRPNTCIWIRISDVDVTAYRSHEPCHSCFKWRNSFAIYEIAIAVNRFGCSIIVFSVAHWWTSSCFCLSFRINCFSHWKYVQTFHWRQLLLTFVGFSIFYLFSLRSPSPPTFAIGHYYYCGLLTGNIIEKPFISIFHAVLGNAMSKLSA